MPHVLARVPCKMLQIRSHSGALQPPRVSTEGTLTRRGSA